MFTTYTTVGVFTEISTTKILHGKSNKYNWGDYKFYFISTVLQPYFERLYAVVRVIYLSQYFLPRFLM